MAKGNLLDPNFYLITDRLSYSIRGEVVLKEKVDGEILQKAVTKAFERFPYFSIRIVKEGEEYLTVPNPLPHNVIEVEPLTRLEIGTEKVNYHLLVVSYYDNKICFNVAHSVTDGAGRAPLTKSVLYYYVVYKYGADISTDGIYLADDPLFKDEEGLPIPMTDIMAAEPTFNKTVGECYNFGEKGIANDDTQREYRFKVSQDEFMKLNKSMDASPSVLVSAMLAQIAWELDPDVEKNIVSNLCMNLRGGLHTQHSHYPYFSCIPLAYQPKMKDMSLNELCTCSRGMVILQSQEENVQYLYKQSLLSYEQLLKLPTLEEKKEAASHAVYDMNGLLSATYLVSYVGRSTLGDLDPYVHAMFTTVDAIPRSGLIVEITSGEGDFYFTFMQDFSSNVIYKAFIDKLKDFGIKVTEIIDRPILAPKVILPS